jgi:hypothetical protein
MEGRLDEYFGEQVYSVEFEHFVCRRGAHKTPSIIVRSCGTRPARVRRDAVIEVPGWYHGGNEQRCEDDHEPKPDAALEMTLRFV